MNRRRRSPGWSLAVGLVAGVLGAATLGGPALADHIDVEVDPDAIRVDGVTVEMPLVVRSASGQRIADAVVIATSPTSIAGVAGEIELDRAVTDELGLATVVWEDRRPAPGPITLTYGAPGDTELETLTLPSVDVARTGQVERSTAGVAIPILGVWVLIGLLVIVWGLIEYALFGMVRVAADRRAPTGDGGARESVLAGDGTIPAHGEVAP